MEHSSQPSNNLRAFQLSSERCKVLSGKSIHNHHGSPFPATSSEIQRLSEKPDLKSLRHKKALSKLHSQRTPTEKRVSEMESQWRLLQSQKENTPRSSRNLLYILKKGTPISKTLLSRKYSDVDSSRVRELIQTSQHVLDLCRQ